MTKLTYQEFLKTCCGSVPRDAPIYRDIFVRMSMAAIIEPEGELPPEHEMYGPTVQVTPFQMLEERMREMELRLTRLEKLTRSKKGGGDDAATMPQV